MLVTPVSIDTDFDTIPDDIDCEGLMPCPDFDQDGKPNHLDIDSDGDGLVDSMEAKQTISTVGQRRESMVPIDSDGDGIADYLDLDSDNDTIPDAIEGHDGNGDGIPDIASVGIDSDGDGLDDAYDTVESTLLTPENAVGNRSSPPNHSGQQPDWRNPDDDGDGILTIEEINNGPLDRDQNGILDYLEPATQAEQIYLPFIVSGNP